METMQENIMLITPNTVDTNVSHLGNEVWVTTPWDMDERKAHNFIDGVISLHNHKKEKAYCVGRIIDVISLGNGDWARNRVAFIFERHPNAVLNPDDIRRKAKFKDTLTESHEQVRY
jgi:hypothetical protein